MTASESRSLACSRVRVLLEPYSDGELAREDRPGRARLLQQRLTSAQIVDAEERVEHWKRAHPWARGTARCTPSGA